MAVAICLLGIGSTAIFGYSVSLQKSNLLPDQGTRETVGVISNKDGDTVLPIQLKVFESKPKENEFGGQLVETTDIKVFPEKIILMAGQEKMFQVIYKGKNPRKEKIYYIETGQQSLANKKNPKKGFGVSILMNYQKKLTVSSKKFKENMYVSAEAVKIEDVQKLKFIFENKGTKLKRYRTFDLRLKTSDGRVKFTKEDLDVSNMIVYPSQRIEKVVDWPEKIDQNANIISTRVY